MRFDIELLDAILHGRALVQRQRGIGCAAGHQGEHQRDRGASVGLNHCEKRDSEICYSALAAFQPGFACGSARCSCNATARPTFIMKNKSLLATIPASNPFKTLTPTPPRSSGFVCRQFPSSNSGITAAIFETVKCWTLRVQAESTAGSAPA